MSRIPAFDRSFFDSGQVWSRIGEGELGGKAEGLVRMGSLLEDRLGGEIDGMELAIPVFVVITTDVFDAFLDLNDLHDLALSGDADRRIAHAFQQGDLPTEILGDLHGLVAGVRRPLAVRSSSLLEDALEHPFAGVYETKMIPNNQPTPGVRFQRLTEAVKLIWASTFFAAARDYRRSIGVEEGREKMAVVVQEVVGRRFGDRFYPHVSAVGRSFNFYPVGRARPEEGVVSLALGLGKTIVDGGRCWSYSPRHPKAPPPFASARETLQGTQTRFWAVNMGKPPDYDPLTETEYLVEEELEAAEYDGTLDLLVSTYDAEADRLRPGTGRDGPRVLTFAPVLEGDEPLNEALTALLELCREVAASDVEIEAALTLPTAHERLRGGDASTRPRLGLVQVRSMVSPVEDVHIDEDDLTGPDVLLASRQAMGHGVLDEIRDVVYLRPDRFEAGATPRIALEIEELNRHLVDAGRHYVLIGFGRWGSSDPWLGVPVKWGQVAGARVLVEAVTPSMNVEPSQGTHFFHNLTSLGAVHMAVGPGDPTSVDWERLAEVDAVSETEHVRHVRLDAPLEIRVDGRRSTGLIRVGGGAP